MKACTDRVTDIRCVGAPSWRALEEKGYDPWTSMSGSVWHVDMPLHLIIQYNCDVF